MRIQTGNRKGPRPLSSQMGWAAVEGRREGLVLKGLVALASVTGLTPPFSVHLPPALCGPGWVSAWTAPGHPGHPGLGWALSPSTFPH